MTIAEFASLVPEFFIQVGDYLREYSNLVVVDIVERKVVRVHETVFLLTVRVNINI